MFTDTAPKELSEDINKSNENSKELRDSLVRLDVNQDSPSDQST